MAPVRRAYPGRDHNTSEKHYQHRTGTMRTSQNFVKTNFAEFTFRGCMKSGPQRVFRYSSRYEKEIPHGFIRCRMELHRTSFAYPQRARAAQDPRSSRGPQRRLLPPKERVPVAPTASRLPKVAHRLVVFQEMALRRYLGKDQPGYPRAP